MRWLYVCLRAVIAAVVLIPLTLWCVLTDSPEGLELLSGWKRLIAWIKEPLRSRAILSTDDIR